MKSLKDTEVNNKNVLIRIDTDVLIEGGVVQDASRLEASVPTLRYLLENNARVTIIGHIGRPDGKEDPELKMRPVEDKMIELLGTHQNWQILENLRFTAGEEENDSEFAKQLATGQDLFVQDAFATCHRAHASTVGVAEILPAYAGFSVEKEVESLSHLLGRHLDGFTIILGGAKIADKLPVIKNLLSRADTFILGGAMANTFLAVRGHHLGRSLVEKESFTAVGQIREELMDDPDKKLYLPEDVVMSKSIERSEGQFDIEVKDLLSPSHEEYSIVDIGAKSAEQYREVISKSEVIFWNGNMGISEVEEFSHGTEVVARAIAESKAKKYAGGGDTTAYIRKIGLEDKFDFLSTGGGATLEFLAGKTLPGLKVLE